MREMNSIHIRKDRRCRRGCMAPLDFEARDKNQSTKLDLDLRAKLLACKPSRIDFLERLRVIEEALRRWDCRCPILVLSRL